MDKETFDLVEKIFTFLKIGNYNKLKNILNIIEKDYPNYYKIFENFKEKRIGEKVSDILSDVFDSLTLGGSPLVLLGKKAEKEEKEKKLISQKGLLKDEISEILKNYSEPSEEKNFLEFLLGKI
ncbi:MULTISPECIES: hypothetical protein [Fusobacterium]|jgi:hypothetical protein|uniref:Uncharacterized protein n=1 Tax=Fusobacterium nucleatum TaxID=851 RepID=A0A323TWW9_FUSNU|nr:MULTISPECIES: hypothetical protein [Fusobacterium]PCR85551.1 hypothetical protein CQA79_03685 [Fusobacterium nucleatum]PZA04703.1 hypothetical protein DNF10_05055 [Fusobacterium nucleatum]QJX50923.1 hypothetical protein HOO60_08485 [Fusobacterium nucleatum]WRL74237.1 hypothetical protein VKN80_06285 [Fusobacterium polymorphum]HCE32125.1 hypothetical protein [Fusobacterium sp.]